MLDPELINAFVKTRKGERVNPLYICIKKGYVDLIQLLIDNSVDLNVKFMYGQTPVIHAVATKQFEIALLLASYGSPIHAVDEFGSSAFDILHDDVKERKLSTAFEASAYR